ncbi:MAG: triose-phosphate isomerase, partial [Oscillospiraceae bacterium]|nr:triose-phosphate isomerase [Oscillospiraceae bacterium]
MRKKMVVGNWKMNKLPNEAIDFIEEFSPLVKDANVEVAICVPFTNLFYSLMNVQGTDIKIGAQNMHWEESGTYTGEVSAQMLKSIGTTYVIIGHPERRKYFAETDETVNKKVKTALTVGVRPIICVGESLEQKE